MTVSARRHVTAAPGAGAPPPRPATTGPRAVTAVWTGDCSGTVELARLAGPHEARVPVTAVAARLPGRPPWRLSDRRVRAAIYQHCLTAGSPFEIYRWVNLKDLAAVWADLSLPTGVRQEWRSALVAAGLVGPARSGRGFLAG